VFRGGGGGSPADLCRSTYRYSNDPSSRYGFIGFRVVLSR